MSISYFQETLKVLRWIRTASDCKKVDDLDKKFCLSVARFAHSFHQLFQSGQKSIVPDAHQRSAWNVPNTRGLDNQSRGLPFSKSSIPIKVVPCDESVFSRAPRHHCRYPGPTFKI